MARIFLLLLSVLSLIPARGWAGDQKKSLLESPQQADFKNQNLYQLVVGNVELAAAFTNAHHVFFSSGPGNFRATPQAKDFSAALMAYQKNDGAKLDAFAKKYKVLTLEDAAFKAMPAFEFFTPAEIRVYGERMVAKGFREAQVRAITQSLLKTKIPRMGPLKFVQVAGTIMVGIEGVSNLGASHMGKQTGLFVIDDLLSAPFKGSAKESVFESEDAPPPPPPPEH